MTFESTIKDLVCKHGKENVRALINIRPVHVYAGMIAMISSDDDTFPVLCEIDETRYKVEEGYKICWKPIAPYSPKKEETFKFHSCNGFGSETFYQSDFNLLVKDGAIQVFVKA